MVPEATMSAYFAGSVKNPSRETFEKLMLAVGGSWDEYDEWTPDAIPTAPSPHRSDPHIEQMQKAFESALNHLEASHTKEVERIEKRYNEILWVHRIEKYTLIALVIIFASYAIFAFTHVNF